MEGSGMADLRYDVRREQDGSWTVVNTNNALPAAVNGTLLHDLSEDEASEMAYLFNHCDIRWNRYPIRHQ
jgi:hypothetical protein